MKTLLVLAEHPDFAETVRANLDPERYRVIHRSRLEDAEPFLVNALAEVCILDVEVTTVQGIWLVEKLRQRAPRCPLILYTAQKPWEWEEEAYLRGVSHVLSKPVRGKVLTALLERLSDQSRAREGLPGSGQASSPCQASSTSPPAITPTSTEFLASSAFFPRHSTLDPRPSTLAFGAGVTPQTLTVLRDFSGILTHSLNAEGMLKQFLLLLRQLLSINRAAIFLRHAPTSFGGATAAAESRRLRAASAVGMAAGLLQHFELSFDAGIGAQLLRLGRILRRHSDEARNDPEAQKEFELLGAQVAVPILDRETVLGVAVFDARITGEPLVNPELELIFHLLEQLGLAIKNIWLHDQLSSNHEMLAGILRELSSACVVVSRELDILHANKMARRYFGSSHSRGAELQFSDLPQALGAKIYQVLKTGAGISTKYEPETAPGSIYNVSIVPFQRPSAGLPASVLMMAEDVTQSRQLQSLEIEAANLRLVKTTAERLAHELGNAMVPVGIHQQLLAEKSKDTESRAWLGAMAHGVERVTRLVNQMRYLARDTVLSQEPFPLAPVLEEAYQEARKYANQTAKDHAAKAQLKYEAGLKPVAVTGDRAAIKHALAEVMLNALQANPADPKVGVRLQAQSNGNGQPGLQVEVQDNGSGFSPEAAQKAGTPFFTTRNVGLGLGLAVSRKIIETHHGKLEVVPPQPGQSGLVRISLPIETAKEKSGG
ncbi:MAG: hypothetical protein C5B50_09290 [Verrucomicrobia bacterium]|nr:MAG: hypothetical protein C5B50_09290 [Verrucomicrobiota bacterium]